jgi:hypothetical protein
MASYYVDYENGLDTNPGNFSAPFKNIPGSLVAGTGTNADFTPLDGTQVYLKRGSIWPNYSRIYLPALQGTEGVTYSDYGDPALPQPRIEFWHSITTAEWGYTVYPNVWVTTQNLLHGYGYTCTRVFFNYVGQNQAVDIAGLTAATPWFFAEDPGGAGGRLYVWTGSASNNPTVTYKTVHAFPYHYNQTSAGSWYGFQINSSKNVTIRNIHFRGGGNSVHIASQSAVNISDNNKVINCTFDYHHIGVAISGTNATGAPQNTNCAVLDCTFDHVMGYNENEQIRRNTLSHTSIYRCASNIDIKGNKFIDPAYWSIFINNLADTPVYGATENINISGNYFYSPTISTQRISAGIALVSGAEVNNVLPILRNVVIEENYFKNTTAAIQLSGDNITVRNNIINGTQQCVSHNSGIMVGSTVNYFVDNIDIYNNTIIDSYDAACKINEAGIYSIAGPVNVYSNIFYKTKTTGNNYLLHITDVTATERTLNIYNNIMFSPITSSTGNWNGNLSISQMETDNPYEVYSNIVSDPELTADFGLLATSPAISTGNFRLDNKDATGAYRASIQEDIGARRYLVHQDSTIQPVYLTL